MFTLALHNTEAEIQRRRFSTLQPKWAPIQRKKKRRSGLEWQRHSSRELHMRDNFAPPRRTCVGAPFVPAARFLAEATEQRLLDSLRNLGSKSEAYRRRPNAMPGTVRSCLFVSNLARRAATKAAKDASQTHCNEGQEKQDAHCAEQPFYRNQLEGMLSRQTHYRHRLICAVSNLRCPAHTPKRRPALG